MQVRLSSYPNLRRVASAIMLAAMAAFVQQGAMIAASQAAAAGGFMPQPATMLSGPVHLHDNLGARRRHPGRELGVDPLRLDLHLPPGRGTLPWDRVATMLAATEAPLVLEVHPPYRAPVGELAATAARLLAA